MRVEIEKKVLVHAPPVNEHTKKWGVYSIPRLWRRLDGRLAVRFNGKEDSTYSGSRQFLPNLYFVSDDDGATWLPDHEGAKHYDGTVMTRLNGPYLKQKDGKILAMRCLASSEPVRNIQHQKEFPTPYNQIMLRSYRLGDLPEGYLRHQLLCWHPGQDAPFVTEVTLDFPERELIMEVEAFDDKGNRLPAEPKIIPLLSFIGGIMELPDGALGGLCFGQNPDVKDRYCGVGYLVVSEDGGKTWKKRSVITPHSEDYAFGLVGDGGEMSITVAPNGDLLCVTRMEMCLDHTAINSTAGTMLFVSKDNGYTWSDAREIADSSVTPHVITLQKGVVIVIYGRPGVHFRYSLDSGKTFSEPVSIIGKTLGEALADGEDYMTCKYWDMQSYSNTFLEILDDDRVAVLFNDLKYLEPGDREYRKAAFVAFLRCVDD
ncbi:MAG: exo-alpha-sialidase [Clostridia bacterium]|nr:exo-alpha-sialidase [Clostridia bacterium]